MMDRGKQKKTYQNAETLFREGKYSESVALFETAVAEGEKDIEFIVHFGQACHRSRLYDKAAEVGEILLDRVPHRREGYRILAEALARGGRQLDKALEILSEAVTHGIIDDDMYRTHLWQIVHSAMKLGELEQLIKAVQSLAEIVEPGELQETLFSIPHFQLADPQNNEIRSRIIEVLYLAAEEGGKPSLSARLVDVLSSSHLLGLNEKALDAVLCHADTSTRHRFNDLPGVKLLTARAFYNKGLLDEAAECLGDVDPDHVPENFADWEMVLEILLREMKNAEQVKKAIAAAERSGDVDQAEINKYRIRFSERLEQSGAYLGAIEQLEYYLRERPGDLGKWRKIALLAAHIAQEGKSRAKLHRILDLIGQSCANFARVAGVACAVYAQKRALNALVVTPERLAAIDLLLVALYDDPGDKEAANTLFSIFLGMNNFDACENLLDLWHQTQPADQFYWISRSRLYAAQGLGDDSLEAAEKAAAEPVANATGYRRLGIANQVVCRYPEAEQAFFQASLRAPMDANIEADRQRCMVEVAAQAAFPQSPVGLGRDDYVLIDTAEAGITPERAREKIVQAGRDWVLISAGGAVDSDVIEIVPVAGAHFHYGADLVRIGTERVPDPAVAEWVLCAASLVLAEIDGLAADSDILALPRRVVGTCRGHYVPRVRAAGPFPDLPVRPEGAETDYRFKYSAAAARIVDGAGPDDVLEQEARLLDHETALVITTAERDTFPALGAFAGPVIVIVECGAIEQWMALDGDALSDLKTWLAGADSLIVTSRNAEEFLEDRMNIACHVHANIDAGLDAAKRFLKTRFCIAVGAGIGNILFVTPLIRAVSEMLGGPVDVVINSPVPPAPQLFGECPFINMAYPQDLPRSVAYDKAYVTSSFGNIPLGLDARHVVSQRPAYDFYSVTRDLNEARYNFLSIEKLLPGMSMPFDLADRMFVRNFDPASRPLPTTARTIGVCGPKKGDIWGLRQWPHFSSLVEKLKDEGWAVRSFGLPDEAVEGAADHTNFILRESVRAMAECDLFICSDGGVFHIADALGLKTLVMFGPTSSVKNGPVNGRTKVLSKGLPCSPCQFTQEFSTCQFADCMQSISVDTVMQEVRALAAASADPVPPAEAGIDTNQPIWNPAFTQTYLGRSYLPLDNPAMSWERLFEANYKFERFQRAGEILDWRQQLGEDGEAVWLKRAKLAHRTHDIAQSLQIAIPWLATGRRKLEWTRLVLEGLYRRHEYEEVLGLYRRAVDDGLLSTSKTAELVRIIWIEVQARLKLWRLEGLREELEKIIELDPEFLPPRHALAHLDWQVYAAPEKREPVADPAKIPLYVISSDSRPPSWLRPHRHKLEIYHLTDYQHVRFGQTYPVVLSDREVLSIEHDDDRDGGHLVMGLPSGDWRLYDCSSGKPEEVSDIEGYLAESLSLIDGTDRPRILVCAHHHLDRDNPRGGERSTHHIVRRLQAERYDVLVVAENKKTNAVECEMLGGIRYVLAGRYVMARTLESVIECWLPDMAITYGETSLRAFEPLVDLGVPYIMFPRDWQEICSPRPYMDMLNRAPIVQPDNRFARLYHHAEHIVTNAEYVARVIKHLHGKDAVTSYVPVSPPEGASGYDPDGPILLINPRKMQGGDLVRSLAVEMPDRQFRVIGVDGMPFPPNVTVEPFYNGPYEELYRGVSLFLFPLIGEDPCGTGRVVFEALHCGIPTISKKIGGMVEVLPDDWLVHEDTIAEWRSRIEQVSAAPSAHERCARLVEAFESEREVEKILSLVRDLIK